MEITEKELYEWCTRHAEKVRWPDLYHQLMRRTFIEDESGLKNPSNKMIYDVVEVAVILDLAFNIDFLSCLSREENRKLKPD